MEWTTPKRKQYRSKMVPVNPTSRQQVTEALQRLFGWRPTAFTDSGQAKFDEPAIKAMDPDVVPVEVQTLLLDQFVVQKRLGYLSQGRQGLLNHLVDHGDHHRLHGYVNHNGAFTGRCTHRNPNLAQVPAVRSPYGKEFRELFIPTPGLVMVGCDMSGIEARGIAHYLARYDGGSLVRRIEASDREDGEDIHVQNQHIVQKVYPAATRQDAKNILYAVAYGAKPRKVGKMLGVGDRQGGQIRRAILESVPGLDRLIHDVQHAAADRGHLVGLDGRKIRPRRAFAALNGLVQCFGAVVMKEATSIATRSFECMFSEGGLVLHVHDEYQWEVGDESEGTHMAGCSPDDLGASLVEAIELAGEILDIRCPLTGEYKTGDSWAETH